MCENNVNGKGITDYLSKNFQVYVQPKLFVLTFSEPDGNLHLKIGLLFTHLYRRKNP